MMDDPADEPESGGPVVPLEVDITGVRFRPNLGPDLGGGGGGSTPTPQSGNQHKKPTVVVTPTDSHSRDIIIEAVKREYLYAMLGLILGVLAIIGGIVLGLNGVAGSTSWTASVLGLSSQVNDAAPGVVLFIIGLFMVWVTKPKVRMRDLRG